MPQLSAIVITKNEAANIGECLDSLAFCDERIVVDCGSTDATVEIARAKGARVEFHEWRGFGPQKNYALSLATEALGAQPRCRRAGHRRACRSDQGARLPKTAPTAGNFRGFPIFAAGKSAIQAGIPTTCCGCFAAAKAASTMSSSTSA